MKRVSVEACAQSINSVLECSFKTQISATSKMAIADMFVVLRDHIKERGSKLKEFHVYFDEGV